MTAASTPREIPSTRDAVAILAGLTLKRLLRGKMIWFVVIAAGLPSLVGLAMGAHNPPEKVANGTLATVQILFAILAPMLIGSAIGDDLGTKKATYLWSRPLPRWTILVGKLLVLAPITAAILMLSWVIALVLGHGYLSGQAIAAVGFGALAVSVVVGAIATIGPKHGIAFSLLYVLFIDLGLDAMPGGIHQLSLVHQTVVMAALPHEMGPPPGSPIEAAIWLVAMAAIWVAVALHQLRTREA